MALRSSKKSTPARLGKYRMAFALPYARPLPPTTPAPATPVPAAARDASLRPVPDAPMRPACSGRKAVRRETAAPRPLRRAKPALDDPARVERSVTPSRALRAASATGPDGAPREAPRFFPAQPVVPPPPGGRLAVFVRGGCPSDSACARAPANSPTRRRVRSAVRR